MRLNLLPGVKSTRLRRGIIVGAALTLTSGLIVAVANQAMAASGCKVAYTTNDWPTGFTANVAITNLGSPISGGWKLTWDYANSSQTITQFWSSKVTQSGQSVTMSNEAWNGDIATNGSISAGFNGSWSGSNPAPTKFTLNGVVCNGGSDPSTPPSSVAPSKSSTSPSTPPSSTPPSSTPPTSNPPSGTHLDNPFVNAKWYVNPEWSARAAAEPGGSKISNQPTGVWLDRIATIAGSSTSKGLAAHLDAALAQGATLAEFVIYDLPGRDCSALASNGELGPTEIARYKSEYIDPIAAIQSNSKYASIRIVNIIEVDSLPNIVTNAGGTAGSTDACAVMKANGNYTTGIQYALSKLHAAGTNNYEYIDAAHHGWLGWDSNFGPSAEMYASTAKGAVGGVNTVDGFITNTANYSALVEPYVTIGATVGGQSVRQSKWVDWNQYTDELSFAQAFRTKLVSLGFNSGIGMLIDTSRNGWGGSARPSSASTSTDMNTWVNASRIDRRIHAGNWCNQSGAGIGERPKAAPASGIDAYVWIKPPGESDGSSSAIANDQGKGFDGMCDPTYTGNARNGNNLTGALPNAPLSGQWFSAQFQQLVANAYPAL